jgi:hypothetical protein
MNKRPLSFYFGNFYSRLLYSLSNYSEFNKNTFEDLQKEGLTLLSKYALNDLCRVVVHNKVSRIEGAIIETGCARGGSSIALSLCKDVKTPLFVYDVFSIIPAPSERDGADSMSRYGDIISGNAAGVGDKIYYGYEEDLYEQVAQSFETYGVSIEKNNIHLVKGLYQDTLQVSYPVSLAHIDCDWYDSVMLCLEKIHPFMVPNGTFIIDDYFSYGGCKSAVDDFFKDKKNQYEFSVFSRLHITKRNSL